MNGAISVVIPAYNRAGLIGETLRSLLNQSVPAKEIVVVDDGSTDGTAEAAQEAFHRWESGKVGKWEGGNLPELKVIRQENAGPGAARNRGLAESTGEFVHFFDSDDIAALNKHEVQLRALQQRGADIAYGAWVKGRFIEDERHFSGKVGRWESGKVEVAGGEIRSEAGGRRSGLKHGNTEQLRNRFEPVGPVLQAHGLPHGDLVKALLTEWSIVPHACLFRRSILERVGGFPEEIWVGEDHLMFLRCLLAGAKVVHAPGTLTYYRVGSEGKLTSVGQAQQRHARDWARFLVQAHEEVAFIAAGGCGNSVDQCFRRPVVGEQMTDVRGQPKRSADRLQSNQRSDVGGGSGSEPVTRDSLPVTTTPSAWFGFRLRAYEAWKDLEKFFPGNEEALKAKLSQMGRFESGKVGRWESGKVRKWECRKVERWKYELAGWWVRKVAGIKGLLTGSRARRCFRVGKYGRKEEALFCSAMEQVPR